MPTAVVLNFASQQLHIYLGLFILILGVTGGIFNIIIFITLQTFRETTCAFYLTTVSIVNIVQLIVALFVRVLSEGFLTDIRKISWVCKLQTYMAVWCVLVSLTGVCSATIDQYLSMSKYEYFSRPRYARRCILTSCLSWAVYGILYAVYWDVSSGICTTLNTGFALYSTRFHFPILLGFLPITAMIIFSSLAFYSARTLDRRQVNIVRLSRDRQLTAMTLVHAVYVVIASLPYIICFIYSLSLSTKDPIQIAQNNLIVTTTVLISYSTYASSFYIYCCVSERFRKQFIYVLGKVCLTRWQKPLNQARTNQVTPDSVAPNGDFPLKTKRDPIETGPIH